MSLLTTKQSLPQRFWRYPMVRLSSQRARAMGAVLQRPRLQWMTHAPGLQPGWTRPAVAASFFLAGTLLTMGLARLMGHPWPETAQAAPVMANAHPAVAHSLAKATSAQAAASIPAISTATPNTEDDSALAQTLEVHYQAASQAYEARELERSVAQDKRDRILTERIRSNYKLIPEAAFMLVQESRRAAQEYRVDPVLLLAIVGQESGFNPYVASSSGAAGLTQTMPRAHPEKMEAMEARGGSIINPADNLRLGASVLRDYLNLTHGDVTQALQRYNGSSDDGSQRYSKKILQSYASLNQGLPHVPDALPKPVRGVQMAWTPSASDAKGARGGF